MEHPSPLVVTVSDEHGTRTGWFCTEHRETPKSVCVAFDDGTHQRILYEEYAFRFQSTK